MGLYISWSSHQSWFSFTESYDEHDRREWCMYMINLFHGHIFHKLDHLFSTVMYYDVHMYYVCWYIVLIIWINDEPSVDKPCIEYISLAHYVVGTCMQVFIYRLFLLTLRMAFITLCRCPLPNIYIGTSVSLIVPCQSRIIVDITSLARSRVWDPVIYFCHLIKSEESACHYFLLFSSLP